VTNERDREAAARVFLGKTIRLLSGADSQPARRIRLRGQRKPIGRYPSLKAGRGVKWEAIHEQHLMWILEADANVVSYLEQPYTLVIQRPGERDLRYTPDLRCVMWDGTGEVIETKDTPEEFEDPEYARKLEIAEQVFHAEGMVFRRLTAVDDIDVEPRLSNSRLISGHRYTFVRSLDELKLREAIDAAGGTLPYGRAIEVLSATADRWDVLARARLHALIVRRVAAVDLYQRLDADALITEAPRRT